MLSNDKSYLTSITQPEALSLQISSDLSYLRNLKDKKRPQKHLTIVRIASTDIFAQCESSEPYQNPQNLIKPSFT